MIARYMGMMKHPRRMEEVQLRHFRGMEARKPSSMAVKHRLVVEEIPPLHFRGTAAFGGWTAMLIGSVLKSRCRTEQIRHRHLREVEV